MRSRVPTRSVARSTRGKASSSAVSRSIGRSQIGTTKSKALGSAICSASPDEINTGMHGHARRLGHPLGRFPTLRLAIQTSLSREHQVALLQGGIEPHQVQHDVDPRPEAGAEAAGQSSAEAPAAPPWGRASTARPVTCWMMLARCPRFSANRLTMAGCGALLRPEHGARRPMALAGDCPHRRRRLAPSRRGGDRG